VVNSRHSADVSNPFDIAPEAPATTNHFETMAESAEERQKRDDQIRDTIMSKLVETGEKDRLKDMLRDRLIQAGWRDELKEYCKDVIRKKGLEKVTVEELVAEITPYGRSKIPEEVKAELLKRIRFFLQST
jgi:enhancer of yellow 2 transcription factor